MSSRMMRRSLRIDERMLDLGVSNTRSFIRQCRAPRMLGLPRVSYYGFHGVA